MKRIITLLTFFMAIICYSQTLKMKVGSDGVYFYDDFWPNATPNTVQHSGSATLIIAENVIVLNTNTFFTNGVLWGGAPPTSELLSVYITGPTGVAERSTNTYSAYGVYSDSTQTNYTGSASWGEVSSIANITNTGGTLTVGDRDWATNYYITATYGGMSATNKISIGGYPEYTGIVITGQTSVVENASYSYSLMATNDLGKVINASASATWGEVSSLSNVTLGAYGSLTIGDRDTTNNYSITAQYGGYTVTNTITIVGTPEAVMSLYPDMTLDTPPGITWSGFDAFDPPVRDDGSAAQVAAEWSRIADAGETILFATGETITNALIYSSGASFETPSLSVYDGYGTALTTNSGFKMMWFEYGGSTSLPVRVGAAEVVGAVPSLISRGDTLRVYGKNLGTICKLWNYQKFTWLSSDSCNGYMAEFTIPDSWANGTYTLKVSNGSGRAYGLSGAFYVTVQTATDWSAGSTRNVVTTYGASGSGTTDDLSAIDDAISSALNGDTIYFPNGNYAVSGQISLQNKKLRLLGQSRDNVNIFSHTNFASSILINDVAERSEFNTLTLTCNDYLESDGNEKLIYAYQVDQLTFDNVKFTDYPITDGSYYPINAILYFSGGDYHRFSDCIFHLKGTLDIQKSTDVTIENCSFLGAWDNNRHIKAYWTENAVVVSNTIANYDDSDVTDGRGWGKGRMFVGENMRNIYFGSNVGTNLGPRFDTTLPWYPNPPQVDQNSGEILMCEGDKVLYQDMVASATSLTLTLAGSSGLITDDWAVTITHGKGQGQTRRITSTFGDQINIDKAWNIIPDTTSLATLGNFSSSVIAYGNFLDGVPRNVVVDLGGSSRNIASAGFQPYGGAIDWVIVNNWTHELRTAVSLYSRFDTGVYGETGTYATPAYFNYVAGNTFDNCMDAVRFNADDKTSGTNFETTNYLGNIVVNNLYTNLTGQAVKMYIEDSVTNATVIARRMFEDNEIYGDADNLTSWSATYWITAGNTTNGVSWP